MKPTSVLVVLSGGQDSTTCLFWARQRFGDDARIHAITFDYGQRHSIEIEAARTVALLCFVASHEVIPVPGCLVSTSPLTDARTPLERYASFEQMEETIGDRVELTFVPMRNTLFLTIAANRAVALNSRDIVTGVCQEDNANYPDCRADYVQALNHAINLSLGISISNPMKIHTPLMDLSKADTVRLASTLPGCMEALAYSHTSYDGAYPPTDMNHANVLRAKGFLDAGFPDPLVLRAWREGLMELPDTPNYAQVGW